MTTAQTYIYYVAAEQSFSKAASRLYVSQPSLSAAVAHEEQQLGFRIFDRSAKPIQLTPQGQAYIEMLEEILESERHMRSRIEQLAEGEIQALRIGGSSSSSHYLLPVLCGHFSRRYPGVDIQLDVGSFSARSPLNERFSLFQKLEQNELDAVICYKYDGHQFSGRPLLCEHMIAAMHKSLVTDALAPYAMHYAELVSGPPSASRIIPRPELFEGIPFFEFSRTSSTTEHMIHLLGNYTVSPHRIINSVHSMVHFQMMCEGMGALLTNDCVAALSGATAADICYFAFDPQQSARMIYLATSKESAARPNTARFLQMAGELCKGGHVLPLCTRSFA